MCNVVVLELPYSTEFGRDSRKFASGVRKYGKFSHFLSHLVVYGGQEKKQILSSLSTANVYCLSRVKVREHAFSHSRDIWVLGCFGVLGCLGVCGCFVFLGCLGILGCLGFLGVLGFWGF